jgi:hypothetical protein
MPEFHIHIDASWVTSEFEELLKAMEFRRLDFTRDVGDDGSYAPAHHLTIKLYDAEQFRRVFDAIESCVQSQHAMTGYIEGEMLPFDLMIPGRPFCSTVAIPFKVELGELDSGTFRESELHVTITKQGTDPGLVRRLRAMGLFCAHIPKPSGMALVFTVQGFQSDIDLLAPALTQYLKAAGGSKDGSIKEERIARWWMSSDDVKRPPVVRAIHWSSGCAPCDE